MLHHDIVNNLCYILNKENIKFETSALNLIATGAQGSMRDALSLTDQAINYSSEKITLNSMQEMLSIIDQKYLIQILDALAEQDGNLILSIANKIEIYNLSYSIVLKDLSLLLHQISLIQISPEILIKDSPNYNEIIQLSKNLILSKYNFLSNKYTWKKWTRISTGWICWIYYDIITYVSFSNIT